MLGFIIGLFVGAFIGVVFMCLFNAATKADEQTNLTTQQWSRRK